MSPKLSPKVEARVVVEAVAEIIPKLNGRGPRRRSRIRHQGDVNICEIKPCNEIKTSVSDIRHSTQKIKDRRTDLTQQNRPRRRR